MFKAGRSAYESIRKHGFSPASIGTIAGASGGAKWLVLSQLDRVIFQDIVPRLRGPVHLIGSSIGAWRFACYAQSDPASAIARFEAAYLEQRYSVKPDIAEITAKTREILTQVLGVNGVAEILSNPVFRPHIVVVRARHLASSEQPLLLGTSLLAAAVLNALNRKTLNLFFERTLFSDPRDASPSYSASKFPTQRVALSTSNLENSIVASGSIPLVLKGVRDIAGAVPGVYRDGGIIDYHLDLPQSAPDRLALYPHFYDHVVPGWFDKKLPWRSAGPANLERTILISPSREFISRLPNGKIPDRTDFRYFTHENRLRAWRGAVAACKELADELHEVIATDRLPARVLPL